ncbi:MAG: vanadium-dependent haloperoxidase [Chloroflexi bacterium]|nr:vanadium-dependent haloperoxidase [Chloroflexota bacterium]
MRIRYTAALLLALVMLCLPVSSRAQDTVSTVSQPATEQDPALAVQWMQFLYDRIQAEGWTPPAASRLYAYAGIALYEAVHPGIPDSFTMSRQLNSMPDMPAIDPNTVYDWPTVANGALSTLLTGLLKPESAQPISLLRQTQRNDRARTVEAEVIERSLAFGNSIGDRLLVWASGDNYDATRDLPYEPMTGDSSYWVYTEANMKASEPHWGMIRPFALYTPDSCAVPLKMPFATDPDSTFYRQALEVMTVGKNLTPEQKDIARRWVDTPKGSGTPAGHWVLIENQLVDVLDLDLGMASMMYGLVGISLGDAFIAAWSWKYQHPLLRPVTYIQEYIDPTWTSFVETPGFPEYPSGHSVVSAAAAEVLTTMFGTVAFTDRSSRRLGFDDRSYTSIEAAAYEAAISRLYGGIHFRAGIENGLKMGRCVGQNVLRFVRLRPIPQGE